MTRAEALVANIGAQLCELRGLLAITETVRQLPPLGARLQDRVIDATCAAFEISRGDMLSTYQGHEAVVARQAAMSLLQGYGWSYPRIGRVFGQRHHTTILYGVRKFRTRLSDPDIQARFTVAREAIGRQTQ